MTKVPRWWGEVRDGLVRLVGVALLASAGLVVAAPPAHGANFTVTNGNDSGSGSLRDAITQAQNAAGDDTVTIDDAVNTITIASTLFHNPSDNGALTITGNVVTIQQTAGSQGGIASLGTGKLTIDSATITGVSSGSFPAVYGNGDVTLTNVTVKDNTAASNTAGVYAAGGTLTLTNSLLENNDAILSGAFTTIGGAWAGTATVTNSTIKNNSPTSGGGLAVGGLFASNGVTVSNSSVTGNTATTTSSAAIGGIGSFGNVVVVGSTVAANAGSTSNGDAAGGVGTAILGLVADVSATNSTISSNSASGNGVRGGGITAGDVSLTYATVAENTSQGGGATNVASKDSQGPSGNGSLTSFASVIAPPQGGGTSCTFDANGTTASTYSYEAGGNTCKFGGGAGDVVNGPDPMLGALANNGGPTQTRMPQSGSSLIDAVPTGSCHATVTTDQRGVARPQGSGCDIGSVDIAGPPPPASPPPPAPACPANAALLPAGPVGGGGVLLTVAPFALLRFLRRRPIAMRLDRRTATVMVLVGAATLVLAACVPLKVPPPAGC